MILIPGFSSLSHAHRPVWLWKNPIMIHGLVFTTIVDIHLYRYLTSVTELQTLEVCRRSISNSELILTHAELSGRPGEGPSSLNPELLFSTHPNPHYANFGKQSNLTWKKLLMTLSVTLLSLKPVLSWLIHGDLAATHSMRSIDYCVSDNRSAFTPAPTPCSHSSLSHTHTFRGFCHNQIFVVPGADSPRPTDYTTWMYLTARKNHPSDFTGPKMSKKTVTGELYYWWRW